MGTPQEITGMTDSRKVDLLRLYFDEPFHVTKDITIYVPTVQDIINFGEDEFWSVVNIFIANTTTFRLPLWEAGIDWNKISDFQLFGMLVKHVEPSKSSILFGDIDFTKFEMLAREPVVDESADPNLEVSPELILYSDEQDIVITEEDYNLIALYIRTMFGMFPKVEKAKGKATKQAIIDEDKMNRENKKDDDDSSSILLPLISSCLNHPGFKYKKNELREVGIVEFMDSVQRLQVYESTTALLKGIYSGMVDAKDIDAEEFNFMREIKSNKNKNKK